MKKDIFSRIEEVAKRLAKKIGFAPAPTKTITDPDMEFSSDYGSIMSYVQDFLSRNAEDKDKYRDYDLMDDEVPEITAGLDVMTDFVIYPDNVNKTKTMKVRPSNKKDKRIADAIDEIDKETGFNRELPSMVRDALKYGDTVEEYIFEVDKKSSDGKGKIIGFKNIPIDTVNVNVKNGIHDREKPITQFGQDGKEVTTLKKGECLHFSLPTDRKRYFRLGKGLSRLEKARLIYRQLRLMEEAIMIHRLSEANKNYAIIVDVGELMGDEALDYLEKYRKRITRKKYIDPSTGRLSYKYNPMATMEDIMVPTRQGSSGNVIPLNSGANSGKNIEDLNYFQNKQIYALGVPKLLIGKEEDINSKSTADTQYISFLRSIRRIQTLLEPGIRDFYTTALERKGFKNVDLVIDWPLLGTIDEERKWRIMQIKVAIASQLSQDMNLVDDFWIYTNTLDMTDSEAEDLSERLDEEEEEAKAEVDAMLANAIDTTDDPEADSEYDTGDEPKSKTPKKTSVTKEPSKKKSKEDVKKELKLVCSPGEFEVINVIIDNMYEDKNFAKVIHEISELTKLVTFHDDVS